MFFPFRSCLPPPACVLGVLIALSAVTTAQGGGDTAKIPAAPGRRPVRLWPPASQPAERPPAGVGVEIGGWRYEAVKAAAAEDGVPWELIATPVGDNASRWTRGTWGQPLPFAASEQRAVEQRAFRPPGVPVIVIPQTLWRQWMSADLQDVVGIHFHECVTDDTARILFTLHKVPADPAPGAALADEPACRGTRIEATLVAPVAFGLDQSIVIRQDPENKELTAERAAHETGHAELSLRVFLEAFAGPQDWDPPRCAGRRSRIAFYWRQEQISRSWEGCRGGKGKLLTQRTTVVLVPPTRWSLMMPIAPERITQKHINEFNQFIIAFCPRYSRLDVAAQEHFHATHGAFERAASK